MVTVALKTSLVRLTLIKLVLMDLNELFSVMSYALIYGSGGLD